MKAGASSAEGAPHLIHGWVGAGLVTINPMGFCHRLLARPYNKFIISLIFQFLSLIKTFITSCFCSSCILAKFGCSIPLLAGLFLPPITPDFISAARLPSCQRPNQHLESNQSAKKNSSKREKHRQLSPPRKQSSSVCSAQTLAEQQGCAGRCSWLVATKLSLLLPI